MTTLSRAAEAGSRLLSVTDELTVLSSSRIEGNAGRAIRASFPLTLPTCLKRADQGETLAAPLRYPRTRTTILSRQITIERRAIFSRPVRSKNNRRDTVSNGGPLEPSIIRIRFANADLRLNCMLYFGRIRNAVPLRFTCNVVTKTLPRDYRCAITISSHHGEFLLATAHF